MGLTPPSGSGAGGGVTDHGDLTGLGDDDHAQYHNNTRGDARYQPLDADLTAIAAVAAQTAYGRAFLALVDAAAARTALALGTAATHAHGEYETAGAAAAAQAASQPLDADLTAIAAVASQTAFGRALLAVADASALQTAAGLSTFVKTLMDDANAGAFLTTLGVSAFVQTLLDDTNAATARATLGAMRELDYAQFTSGVSPTATTEGTADTVVTGNAVTFDGATVVMVEFFAFSARPAADSAGRSMSFYLYDGLSSIGRIGVTVTDTAGDNKPMHLHRRLTPSAGAHTYSVRAAVNAGTGNIGAGAGGNGADVPGFIRILTVAT